MDHLCDYAWRAEEGRQQDEILDPSGMCLRIKERPHAAQRDAQEPQARRPFGERRKHDLAVDVRDRRAVGIAREIRAGGQYLGPPARLQAVTTPSSANSVGAIPTPDKATSSTGPRPSSGTA